MEGQFAVKPERAKVEGALGKPSRRVRKPKRPETYHHGSLREALLQAAERILERDGIQGLTLRAAPARPGSRMPPPRTTSATSRAC